MKSENEKVSKPIIIGVLVGIVLTIGVVGSFFYIQQLNHEIASTKAELSSTKKSLAVAQTEKTQIAEQKKIADKLLEVATEGLSQATAQLAKKPELPINVSYRQALMGDGLVAQFTNNSDRFLSIVATFLNPTTNQHMTTRLDLAPRAIKEVGHLEGWTFSSGDQLTIKNNDYEPTYMTIR
ncbi:MAG: hypothetical protein SFU55_01295 [Methylophilus sp.]|nr:hypothetical protein [Methylophilus sp.]